MPVIVDVVASERNSILNRSDSTGSSFVEWLQGGQFSITSLPSGFELIPYKPDLASAGLATDCARLLLAGRETLWSVKKARDKGSLHPAWSSIQAYYAAFYYASAFFRLVGRSNAYFQVRELTTVRNLLNLQGITALPGSGLYELTLTPNGNQLTAAKRNSVGSHEAVWSGMREFLESIQSKISTYGQFSQDEQSDAVSEIMKLISATRGLGPQDNLSATRNSVQYRQELSCWHPIGRSTKRFHETDRISQIVSDSFTISQTTSSATAYDEFCSKCLAICGFVHHLAITIARQSPAYAASSRYKKYHDSLAAAV